MVPEVECPGMGQLVVGMGTRDFLSEQVGILRAREISWAEIGAALGISRQAAWDRFSE